MHFITTLLQNAIKKNVAVIVKSVTNTRALPVYPEESLSLGLQLYPYHKSD